ncbi:hypothetical protein CEXT_477111 [Caerostris extrusa]|uniref:Uncharacterized protein n=1 Tax=Caerostris extrusa TaxID=172846 RepID=A0AAV4VPU9_CAEEX|nr:hypothetical protein CEXT_477111 [Caerostris extrusa]
MGFKVVSRFTYLEMRIMRIRIQRSLRVFLISSSADELSIPFAGSAPIVPVCILCQVTVSTCQVKLCMPSMQNMNRRVQSPPFLDYGCCYLIRNSLFAVTENRSIYTLQ